MVDVTVLGLVGGAPGGETPRVADSSAAGAGLVGGHRASAASIPDRHDPAYPPTDSSKSSSPVRGPLPGGSARAASRLEALALPCPRRAFVRAPSQRHAIVLVQSQPRSGSAHRKNSLIVGQPPI